MILTMNPLRLADNQTTGILQRLVGIRVKTNRNGGGANSFLFNAITSIISPNCLKRIARTVSKRAANNAQQRDVDRVRRNGREVSLRRILLVPRRGKWSKSSPNLGMNVMSAATSPRKEGIIKIRQQTESVWFL